MSICFYVCVCLLCVLLSINSYVFIEHLLVVFICLDVEEINLLGNTCAMYCKKHSDTEYSCGNQISNYANRINIIEVCNVPQSGSSRFYKYKNNSHFHCHSSSSFISRHPIIHSLQSLYLHSTYFLPCAYKVSASSWGRIRCLHTGISWWLSHCYSCMTQCVFQPI